METKVKEQPYFMPIPSEVEEALFRLEEAGFEAFVVGGCVRDALMGTAPHDYDITTSATPEEVEQVFAGYRLIETGLKHGTVTVMTHGIPLEITTYRVESGYSDHRHPDAVAFTRSLEKDLARRDFTVNAMAYAPHRGVQDFFGGREDLANGILRCVGEPEKRFEEDALRILRAVRFSSCLGFSLEEKTRAAALAQKESLSAVSRERIYVELTKMLCGKDVRRVLLEETEILSAVLPELLPMKGLNQKNYHHCFDVLTHTAVAVEHILPKPVLRWATLCHDMGKPACFTVDENGVGHFKGHPSISAAMAEEILIRLKSSNEMRNAVVKLVKWHDAPIEPTKKAVRRALQKMTPELFDDLLLVKLADDSAKAPEWQENIHTCQVVLPALKEEILTEHECFSLKDLCINGRDLQNMGLPVGPAIGCALKAALEAVVGGEVPNEKGAVLSYLQKTGTVWQKEKTDKT